MKVWRNGKKINHEIKSGIEIHKANRVWYNPWTWNNRETTHEYNYIDIDPGDIGDHTVIVYETYFGCGE